MVRFLLIIPLFFLIQSLSADRGMIPFHPQVEIFEPTQRAMIAWNGEEEILLLTTDISASESTRVLEVLPLPDEPKVKKGDPETFRKAVRLINSKIQPRLRRGNGGRKDGDQLQKLGGEVTFHKQIGAHDISVTHLLDRDGFVAWVKNYLKSIGVEAEILTEPAKQLVESYIKDGFEWFVFDVVSVGKQTVTNEPIQYRFKTQYLFYPLRITGTVQGKTFIELLILTPRLLNTFADLPASRIHLQHSPITITSEELKGLDKDMYDLLSGYTRLKLRIWGIKGSLKMFKDDLIVY